MPFRMDVARCIAFVSIGAAQTSHCVTHVLCTVVHIAYDAPAWNPWRTG